jgi:hypothetical protein
MQSATQLFTWIAAGCGVLGLLFLLAAIGALRARRLFAITPLARASSKPPHERLWHPPAASRPDPAAVTSFVRHRREGNS